MMGIRMMPKLTVIPWTGSAINGTKPAQKWGSANPLHVDESSFYFQPNMLS
jgi:hypothetical protein